MLLLHVLFFAAIALSMSEKRRLIKAPRGVVPRAPSEKAAQGLFPGNDNWEAGYIDFLADGTTFHFFYFLARSRNDPVNDPTVFWFTGGPGCSSALAMLAENGPWKFANTSDPSSLYVNPYSWNDRANVV